MTLQFIDIDALSVSSLNVRKYGAKDCADLVTSIRAIGLLQPLLVRETDQGFEVIAGQRRLNACRILAEEDGKSDPLPCLIMGERDDATAIEASLAENIERLPMDEVDQYKAFAKLAKEGRDTEDIAASFGITERMVHQRLALGRLYAPILTAYRKGDIHARDIRSLTMASPKQQKAWWALVKDEDANVPTGQRLKDWLFGGTHIPVANALFDVDASGLVVVTDLFGEDACFADARAFWPLQNEAIAERVDTYRQEGWADIVVMDIGAYFAGWDHCRTDKAQGGKVFITCTHQGEVAVHEGYLTRAEVKRREAANKGEAPPKPELTKPARNYVDLHRHAAVRSDLLAHQGLALRLIAAHMLAGSSLWRVEADPQRTAKPEIAESLAGNKGQQAFEAEREAISTLLGLPEAPSILYDWYTGEPRPDIDEVFGCLQELPDADILRILTCLMAESLSVDNPLTDDLGTLMGTDMRDHWQPDQTFFDLVRDKVVLNAMVGEWAGDSAAKEHVTATAKTQRGILISCMCGLRKPVTEDWRPRYMSFPEGSYREDESAKREGETADHRNAA